MTLVELKKFQLPPAVWTCIIVLGGWLITTYVPPEYKIPGMIGWAAILSIAKYVGVSREQVYEVATSTGVTLPGDLTPAGAPAPAGAAMMIRPVTDSSKVARALI